MCILIKISIKPIVLSPQLLNVPCHSRHTSVLERNDVITHKKICTGSLTNADQDLTCVDIHGNRGTVQVESPPPGSLGFSIRVPCTSRVHMTAFTLTVYHVNHAH